jgi:[ribosomal protein S18]-alanine N-acetyltransferase
MRAEEREPGLRPARSTDYAAIAGWVPDAEACARWAGPRLPFPFRADELETLLAMPGAASWCLAVGDGPPCAFGQHWVRTPGAVHLGRIIVAPERRGRGLGRLLCRQLVVAAVGASGAGVVTLRVYRDNRRAAELYRSLGFVPVESESTPDVFFMRLPV